MATREQVEFLHDHITHVWGQTVHARDTATDVHHQITADRYLRALTATRMLVDLIDVDGDQSTMHQSPVWPAVAETLGFE